MKYYIPEILSLMIEANQAIRKEFPEAKEQIDTPYYLAEFCTIRLNIGRRTGKTQYIKDNSNINSCVIVPKEDWARNLYGVRSGNVNNDGLMVLTICNLLANPKDKYNKYTTIYIDEPSFVFPDNDTHRFYAKIANPHLDQTIIMVGT